MAFRESGDIVREHLGVRNFDSPRHRHWGGPEAWHDAIVAQGYANWFDVPRHDGPDSFQHTLRQRYEENRVWWVDKIEYSEQRTPDDWTYLALGQKSIRLYFRGASDAVFFKMMLHEEVDA